MNNLLRLIKYFESTNMVIDDGQGELNVAHVLIEKQAFINMLCSIIEHLILELKKNEKS